MVTFVFPQKLPPFEPSIRRAPQKGPRMTIYNPYLPLPNCIVLLKWECLQKLEFNALKINRDIPISSLKNYFKLFFAFLKESL